MSASDVNNLSTDLSATGRDLLAWLFARQRFGIKPGLARPKALLYEIGEPQRHFRSVLVGGTNGKGSTASTLASIFNTSDQRTALCTSPHLSAFTERFVVDGEQLELADVLAALEEIKPAIEETDATFFEATTALACYLFARADVDLAVMEVGLGGRFDATNVLEPVLSIITGISLDHTHILGESVEEIAVEKAGIMRSERLCLTGAKGKALAALRREAEVRGTPLWALGDELTLEHEDLGWQGLAVDLRGPHGKVSLQTPLLGAHQARNVALAAVAAQALGVSEEVIQRGAAQTTWVGRLEPLPYQERTFLLDGAHNEEAALALADTLRALGVENALLVFGVASGKEVEKMASTLSGTAREVILTKASLSPRATEPSDLTPFWNVPSSLTNTPQEALELALTRSQPGEVIVVAGSLYLIGEVRPLLLGESAEPWSRSQ